jgi:histone-lysine N-methyltransferase SETMAR
MNLDSIVTGDEKWVLYSNVKRHREWVDKNSHPTATPKEGLHPKKCLLSLFWDTEGMDWTFHLSLSSLGVIHYEILPMGHTINAQHYCEQLDRLREALIENRPHKQHVLFLHDNATPHTAKITKEKLKAWEAPPNQPIWEVLPHPPYSPDLAPTDFKAFRSLQNWINGKRFATEQEVRNSIDGWIAAKPTAFWVKGIAALPDRWADVLDYEGDYFPD